MLKSLPSLLLSPTLLYFEDHSTKVALPSYLPNFNDHSTKEAASPCLLYFKDLYLFFHLFPTLRITLLLYRFFLSSSLFSLKITLPMYQFHMLSEYLFLHFNFPGRLALPCRDIKTLTNRETVKIFPHMQRRRILLARTHVSLRQSAAECDGRRSTQCCITQTEGRTQRA